MPKVGILFDIDELEGGLYGYAAYKIFFEAIDTRQFAECSLSDGDINATLSGQVNQYCIAVEAPYASSIAEIKNALSQSNAKGLLPHSSRFFEDALVRAEPLVFAGRINFAGELVGCQTGWVFEAWQKSQAKHQITSSRQLPHTSTLAAVPKEQETVHQGKDQPGSIQWQIGDIIENRWEVKEILKGGLGIVYIGYDREFDDTFAAKTFQDEIFTRNPQIAERFVQEATIWMSLDLHQNITEARAINVIGGKPYLFLEYITGGDLSRWIGTPRLTEDLPQVLRFAIQFCDGMIYALSKGIKVHRDIKPQNCLITDDNILKVTDFGLARAFEEVTASEHESTEEKGKKRWGCLGWLLGKRQRFPEVSQPSEMQTHRSDFTHTGMAAGTYTHMAPEQFDNAKHVDVRADIYSFGVMLYQMLTGEMPFGGNVREDFRYQHRNSPPPKLQLQSTVPQSLVFRLDSIVQACLAKDPPQRFNDFDDVRQPLVETYKALTGEAPVQPATGLELEVGRWNDKGLGLINLGKLEEGIKCLERALNLDPRFIGAWNNKGLALIELGKVEEALLCFERAIEIFPDYAHAWNNKGAALMKLERPDEALTCFERAININRRYDAAWSNKGAALDKLMRPADALGAYTLAIHYNPHYAIAWYGKGLTLAKAGQIQEALFHFEQAKRLGLPQAAQIIEVIQQNNLR